MRRTSQIQQEKALLIVANPGDLSPVYTSYQVEELHSLALTAGAKIGLVCQQNLKEIHPATFIGKGKLEEIKEILSQNPIDVVLVNQDLSPVQQRNLERHLNHRIIDRTELILDIFAQHAQSKDGQIQVELAQLRYLRPRLTGRGIDLSRLGGGIGTRGPGETKLEVDRRKIDQRIARLRQEWTKIREARRLQRKSRLRSNISSAVLIGYTNAGKSTLLNRLTDAEVTARDQLFSTVDTTTRRLTLPNLQKILLSDTVGFISDLPEPLLAAFRATLEVVEEATILVHVVDAGSPFLEEQIHAVNEVLQNLECSQKPILTVFNKIDRLNDDLALRELERRIEPNIRCSALQDRNLEPLKEALIHAIEKARQNAPQPPSEEEDWDQLPSVD